MPNEGHRMVKCTLNAQVVELDVAENMLLLWALRDTLGLMGTKFG
jgi:aerobic-type carbon monoxide dehydrogenase small subunit (CoxS/CutS family)